ncbi:MAG: hypothetical protein M1819_000071 [Sarea resinae]|nr:MAG: hypothetical protein M1819_000071 [Sarea resinae]
MSALLHRPQSATRALRPLISSSACTHASSSSRSAAASFSTSRPLGSADSHEDHYEPPSGWLFGVAPGEKYKKEGWENVWIYGFFGSLILGGVAYAFKPDSSIQTWALEEARRRLEAEGILPETSSKEQ